MPVKRQYSGELSVFYTYSKSTQVFANTVECFEVDYNNFDTYYLTALLIAFYMALSWTLIVNNIINAMKYLIQ